MPILRSKNKTPRIILYKGKYSRFKITLDYRSKQSKGGREGGRVLRFCGTFWDQNHVWFSAKKLEKCSWSTFEGGRVFTLAGGGCLGAFMTLFGIKSKIDYRLKNSKNARYYWRILKRGNIFSFFFNCWWIFCHF